MIKVKTTSNLSSKMDTVKFEIVFSSIKETNEEAFSDVVFYSKIYKDRILSKGFKNITVYACRVNKNYIFETVKDIDGFTEKAKTQRIQKGYKATQLFVVEVPVFEEHQSFKYIYGSLKDLNFDDFRYYWAISKTLENSTNRKLRKILMDENQVQAAEILNKNVRNLEPINIFYGIKEDFNTHADYRLMQKSAYCSSEKEDYSFNFNLLDELFKPEYAPEIEYKDSITVEWNIK